jgi:hypothetical protein
MSSLIVTIVVANNLNQYVVANTSLFVITNMSSIVENRKHNSTLSYNIQSTNTHITITFIELTFSIKEKTTLTYNISYT